MKCWPIVFIALVLLACDPRERWLRHEAPEKFEARFTTTQGTFVAEFDRTLSPEGVDRVYQLIRSGFYTDICIYRVVPNFVAQFGIHNDSTLNNFWESHKISDEAVNASNVQGSIAFARGGPETRSTQLFINLRHNAVLDSIHYSDVTGFPVLGQIIEGFEVIQRLNSGYGEAPGSRQDSIYTYGNQWLDKHFPGLDYLQKVELVK